MKIIQKNLSKIQNYIRKKFITPVEMVATKRFYARLIKTI